MAAKEQNDDLLKRLNAVVDSAWNHVTPGTPDHFYVERFKKDLREAISPTPAQPEKPAGKQSSVTTSNMGEK